MAIEDVLARARLLVDLHRYDEADPLLAQALAQEPDNENGLSLFSRGLVARLRFQEADAVAERLLRAHPDSVRGLMSMARIKCMLGREPEGGPVRPPRGRAVPRQRVVPGDPGRRAAAGHARLGGGA